MRGVFAAWPSDTKLSTKISTYSRGVPIVGSDGSQVQGTWAATPGTGSRDRLSQFVNGTFAAI